LLLLAAACCCLLLLLLLAAAACCCLLLLLLLLLLGAVFVLSRYVALNKVPCRINRYSNSTILPASLPCDGASSGPRCGPCPSSCSPD
jgi:hypothetical protein